MRFVGMFWKVYLGVAITLLLFWVARVLFSEQKKHLVGLLPIIAIWPLALLHSKGRKQLGQVINGVT